MQLQVPKQFVPIGGKPVLMHTIDRFYTFDPAMGLVVVLPADQVALWEALCQEYGFGIPHQVAIGGGSRFASVRSGLEKIKGEGLVAVHDGVRPFVSGAIIQKAFEEAAEYGNAVVAVPLKDSIRRLAGRASRAEDRSQYRLVQTPQCFWLDLLRQAYTQPEDPSFTDDASVVERLGTAIRLVEGSYQNIKITTSEDLLWAEAFLSEKN